MAFYETVLIIRHDISSTDVDKIIEDFTAIIKNYGDEVVKTEYWGSRTLAYEISNNKKGHYVFMGIDAADKTMKELEQKIKLSENVIRHLTIKVDAIDSEPSAILKVKSNDKEGIVNVTISKEDAA